MIQAEYREDINPVCPHCNSPVNQIYIHKIKSFLGKRFLYFCSNCHKVLGFSHRKAFWMG